MPQYRESKILPYSATQLFELVCDVKAYPEFLPWCVAARIHSYSSGVMLADLVIGFKVFRETFTSKVEADRQGLWIKAKQARGPFTHLENNWSFQDCHKGCAVDFSVDFAFKSNLLTATIEPLFFTAQRRLIEAFEARAAALYSS